MSLLPHKNNTRIEITIEPWAIQGSTGTPLTDSLHGIWFTSWSPMYSSMFLVETLLGPAIANVPKSFVELAIWESGAYVDALARASCPEPNNAYFSKLRQRYVTLQAAITLSGQVQGLNPVTRKVLGDFEIEYASGNSNKGGLLDRLLDEMYAIEPAVMSKGCLGVGTDHRAEVIIKGENDVDRIRPSRLWNSPVPGELGNVRGARTRPGGRRHFRSTLRGMGGRGGRRGR